MPRTEGQVLLTLPVTVAERAQVKADAAGKRLSVNNYVRSRLNLALQQHGGHRPNSGPKARNLNRYRISIYRVWLTAQPSTALRVRAATSASAFRAAAAHWQRRGVSGLSCQVVAREDAIVAAKMPPAEVLQ